MNVVRIGSDLTRRAVLISVLAVVLTYGSTFSVSKELVTLVNINRRHNDLNIRLW